MRKNSKDRYYRLGKNRMVIQDADSGEYLLFYVDRENMIVFRSMLEEDAKTVISRLKVSSSEKRKRLKVLADVLPMKNSQNYFFVIEEIQPIDYFKDNFKSEEWDWIYGYPRRPIGLGVRNRVETGYLKDFKKDENIEAILFDQYESRVEEILSIIKKVGKYYGIEGQFYIQPVV